MQTVRIGNSRYYCYSDKTVARRRRSKNRASPTHRETAKNSLNVSCDLNRRTRSDKTRMSSFDKRPFLAPDEEPLDFEDNGASIRKPQRRRSPWQVNLIIHLCLIVLYTAVSVLVIQHYTGSQDFSSIKNVSVAYTETLFRNLTNNIYAGPPSPESDEEWKKLLAPMYIRVTEDELKRYNQHSVPLPEGGGHLAWLGVFHELHCIVSRYREMSASRESDHRHRRR